MAKTGESYTSARRSVMARAGDALVPTQDPMARAKGLLRTALKKEPRLTRLGIGVPHHQWNHWVTQGEQFEAERMGLSTPGSLEEIEVCAQWLGLQKSTKIFSGQRTSYGYKHDVEEWSRSRGSPIHVYNGALIAAALGLGMRVKVYPGSPNVAINISAKPWDELHRKAST